MPSDENDEGLSPEELAAQEAEAKAAREQEIADRLKLMDSKLTSSETLAKLMSDPDVRAVLDAKQAGKKVKLVEEEEEDEEEELDLDSLTNKQLTKHLLKQVTKAVGVATEQRIAKVEELLQGVIGHIQGSQTADVRKQIESMKEKFPDFEDLRERMAEINHTTPGLSVEELYLLAKVRETGLDGLATGLRSERPSSSTARPPRTQQRKTALPTGKRGFDVLLQEALEGRVSKAITTAAGEGEGSEEEE